MSDRQMLPEHAEMLSSALSSVQLAMSDIEGKSFGPTSHEGAMIASPDPADDNMQSRLITIESVQQLKEIAGISDDHFRANPNADRAVNYPEPPVADLAQAMTRARDDSCALESLMDPQDLANVGQAILAYINGDSAKVAHYEPTINALRFPAQAMLTVAQNVTVTAANPLIIGPQTPVEHDPILGAICLFGTVTIEPGGYIDVRVPVMLKAARIISK